MWMKWHGRLCTTSTPPWGSRFRPTRRHANTMSGPPCSRSRRSSPPNAVRATLAGPTCGSVWFEVADLFQDFSSVEPAMSSVQDQKQFAGGGGVRPRLPLMPVFLSLSIADRVGGAMRTRTARLALPPWRAGLSIIIPERDSPQLLLNALASLHDALDAVDEPCQVVVVANGAARNAYDEVVAKYPQ